MRRDGTVMYFAVQHIDSSCRWVESALDHLLFKDLTYDQKKGPVGDAYRILLDPQSASSDLWQRYGIHGFVEVDDARRMLQAISERNPDMTFRVVCRSITQATTVVMH